MKIYQLHQYGGMYEDRYDFIVASYISAKKAVRHKRQLEKEEKIRINKVYKCYDCPIANGMTKIEYNNDKNILDEYCNNQELDFENYRIFCENMDYDDEDNMYRIEKVEVIE